MKSTLLFFGFSLVGLLAPLQAEEIKRSKYFIAIKKNEGNIHDSLETFTPFLPTQQHYYADPMLYKHNGVNYIFYEDYDYKKGIISYVSLNDNGEPSKPALALELPFHLSFPFVFSEGDEIFMIPETYSENEVALFKAVEFPDKWEKKQVLTRGADFADSILFKHDGYYWLFTAVHGDTLRIYYATSLDAEFKPHPINRKNIRGRNAGGVYYDGSRLIRPVMDCSNGYGGSMKLNEIVKLTPTRFKEETILHILPTWAPDLNGTHTYNQNEDYIVYDGRRSIYPMEDALYSTLESPQPNILEDEYKEDEICEIEN